MTLATARVGDIAEQLRGVSFDKGEASDRPGPGLIPILRAGNITDQGLEFNDLMFVPATRVSQKQKIQVNDVVIAASSGSLDVVGKAAQLKQPFDGSFGAFCKVLRPGPEVEPRYFAHFFNTPQYRRRVSRLAAGANINNLKNEHLDEMRIPLPDRRVQRRIAEVLDRADALRAKRRTAIEQLETLKQSIFHDTFGDPIVNAGRYPTAMLEDLVDPERPITYGIVQPGPHMEDGVPYIRVVDMQGGVISGAEVRRTSPSIAKSYKRSEVRPGDIILSIRGHVGRLGVVPPELGGANLTQDTARLAVVGAAPLFVMECLRSEHFQRWMGRRTKGAAVRGINLADVRKMPIPVPDVPAQQKFVEAALAVDRAVRSASEGGRGIGALFAALQQRGFVGAL